MAIVNTQRDWPKVCRAIGRPELAHDPRYATLEERVKEGRMCELIQICDAIFATQPMDYWKRRLEEADVPYSVVATLDEVVVDPQLAANGVFVEFDDPALGRVRSVDTPLNLEAHPKVPRTTAPRLGEHTRAVLGELGLDAQQVDALIERRVVAGLHAPTAPVPAPG
jgi:formyl-CoA transferase